MATTPIPHSVSRGKRRNGVSRVDAGEHDEVLPGLWQTKKLCNVIQVPGLDHDGIGRLLAGIGGEPVEGKEELGPVADNLGKIGFKPKGIRYVFEGGDAGGTYFRFGDVGDDPPHGPGPGGFQPRLARRITGRHT